MAIVTVIKNRLSDWRVVCPSIDKPGFAFAAQELQQYLLKISGCNLPLAQDTEKQQVIVIGLREDLSRRDKELLPARADGCDGYSVNITPASKSVSPRIIIGADNGRGAIYGVYDLLERLGCRWFYPQQDPQDKEVVPNLDTVTFETGVKTVASPVPYRICNVSSWFFVMNPSLAITQMDWAMKCRYNTMGWQSENKTSLYSQYEALEQAGVFDELGKRAMMLHGPAHSFDHFLSNDYFDDHPEWFGMQEGKRVKQVFGGSQFCWSNAEARKQFTDNIEHFALTCTHINILCTLGFDGGPCCTCPECTKSSPSDLMAVLMNEVAERLEVSVPQVIVETSGGYSPVKEPPQNVKLHHKLRIVWAHWGRHHGMGYDNPTYDWLPNVEAWRKSADNRLTLCQYYTDNFAEPWIAPPYIIALEGDRKYLLQNGIDGWYMLMWPLGYWWNHGLNGYLGGICLYDVTIDPYQAIHDYALHYFGPEAGLLLAAYYVEWAQQVELAYKIRDDAEDKHREMLAAQRRNWIEPAVLAVSDDPVLSHRVGKVEKLHTAAHFLTEVARQHQEITELRSQGEFKTAKELLEFASSYTDGVIDYLNDLANLEQGLIDRNEIPSFIRMKIKQWIEEETNAVEEQLKV